MGSPLLSCAWALGPYTENKRRPIRLLQRVLGHLHAIEKPQHTLRMSLTRRLLGARTKRRCAAVSPPEKSPARGPESRGKGLR